MKTKEIKTNEQFLKTIGCGISLIDFCVPWCATSLAQQPIIQRLARRFRGRAAVVSFNIDIHQETGRKMGITGVPTLAVFKNGKEIKRFVGVQSEQTLSDALQKALKKEKPDNPKIDA